MKVKKKRKKAKPTCKGLNWRPGVPRWSALVDKKAALGAAK